MPDDYTLKTSLVVNRRLIRLKKQTHKQRKWFHTLKRRIKLQAQKRATEVALFNDQAELSSVWPLPGAAVPPWWCRQQELLQPSGFG